MLALSLNSVSLTLLALLASFGGADGADCLGWSLAGLPPASRKQFSQHRAGTCSYQRELLFDMRLVPMRKTGLDMA